MSEAKAKPIQEALSVIVERGKDYGSPYDDYRKVAMIWSAVLGVEVTPQQASLCMIGVKMARLAASPNHYDSYVDIAGYAGVSYACCDAGRAEEWANPKEGDQ